MDDSAIRKQLEQLILGQGAHVPVERALANLPREHRGTVPTGLVHSVWQLLEHIRIAQEDLIQYAVDPAWQSPEWPQGYWPTDPEPPDDGAWQRSLEDLRKGRDAAIALVRDAGRDLTAPLPHAPQHTLLRQLMLVADHAAYHGAQIVDTRRVLGAWPPG